MATPALVPDPFPPVPPIQRPSPAAGPRLAPRAERGASPLWIHVALFAVTLLSTTLVGMRYMSNFHQGLFPLASDADIFPYKWIWANLSHFSEGLPFSLTLLSILLTHEFGHYFACRYYGVDATLPFLLPAPSLSGTAGAIIRLRSRVESRKALLAIGAMGPLCGFIVALALCLVGLACSRPVAAEPRQLAVLAQPLLLRLCLQVFGSTLHLQPGTPLLWHPVLVASWIGLLITALNLIPAGQLDGGHIIYALSPKAHRIVTCATMAALVFLGIFCWLGWLLWCAFLLLPGMRHPTLESTDPLAPAHWLLAVSGLVVFILSITFRPFSGYSLLDIVHRFPWWHTLPQHLHL